MHSIPRRQFMLGTLGSLAIAGLKPSRSLAIDPIGRTRPSHIKLSLAAYSYRQYLDLKKPKMDLFDFANLAADLGLDAIEPTSYYFPSSVDDDYLRRLRRHAFLLGLDISGTAVGNNFCLPAGPKRDEQIALVRTWIDRAAVMCAPVIRIFAGTTPRGESEETAYGWAVECMSQVLPYAGERGVMLALENHGGITTSPEQLLRLVKAVDSPFFGVNLDTGNFRGADPYAEMAELAPYAINVQVKTEISPGGGKKVEADLERIVSILRDARYSGYLVLEYEAEPEPIAAIPAHVKRLRDLLANSQ